MTIPNIDFETYSEAGFVWSESERKWRALPGAPQGKKGLPVVGASVYVEHPTFEVLTLSYDLRQGAGVQRWRPGLPPPVDLLAHVASGGLISGWNSAGFEMKVWQHCVDRYFWPPLPLSQVRDTMAAARAFVYPGTLGKAGEVMGLKQQKNADGKRLLDKFSIPRNPTKANAARRIKPEDDPADAEKLYAYCDEDVLTEQEAASLIPPLSPKELAAWQTDRIINDRGVQIDLDGVHNCIAIINQAHSRYNAELRVLTGGTVERASELAKLQGWLGARGVVMASMDEEAIDAVLARELPPSLPGCRRALEIRQSVGSASVKKVFTMANMVSRDGRLRDLFVYHGARTGRPTGSGPQPTNLPNSAGTFAMECEGCDKHYGASLGTCPWCGASSAFAHKIEWSAECAEDALESFKPRSLDWAEYVWGDSMAALSGSLRALFVAAPGHDLICSDYSSIEAVGLAMTAGEQWRIDLFRTHGKIYEMSAAKITGIPFEEFMRHAGYTNEQLQRDGWWLDSPANEGGHHPMRKKIGKVAELACFSPDTQVLTDRGYVGIVDVRLTDKLWDGREWVNHEGVVPKGLRRVINLDGVKMTPTHPISTGRLWKAASELASNEDILFRALEIGSGNLPWTASCSEMPEASRKFGFDALAVATHMWFSRRIFSSGGPRAATPAPKRKAQRLEPKKDTESRFLPKNTYSLTWRTAVACSIAWLQPSGGAIASATAAISTMAGAASTFAGNGGKIKASFSSTSSLWRDGMTRALKWIGATLMGTTNRGICGSSRNKKIRQTAGPSKNCKPGSRNLSAVYDIMNSGPRHRFTIKTNSGHLLVHNSGYQGWVCSWKAFGADEFMGEEEIKQGILAWRAASPAIVELWGGQERNWKPDYFGVEGMFVLAILNPGKVYRTHGMDFQMRGDALFLRLLSGRELTYHRPRLAPSTRRSGTYSISYEGWNSNPKNGPMGWYRMETWGGRLVENINQAQCRDIQWHGVQALERAGYPIVLHVYDEDVAEVPEGFGSVEEFERIMGDLPEWCADWPIKATGGWRRKRYGK